MYPDLIHQGRGALPRTWVMESLRVSSQTADAIIVAAGESRRMGPGPSKVLRLIAGKSLMAHTLEVFQHSPLIRRIVVVGRESDQPQVEELIEAGGFSKAQGHWCPGGAHRAGSVHNGLKKLHSLGSPDWVLIHDAARPFLPSHLIKASLEAARSTGASIVALPVKDTIKEADTERLVVRTLDRTRLWQMQTPQTFRFDLVWSCFESSSGQEQAVWTDDGMAVENQGVQPVLVPGDVCNFKITTPEDMLYAEFLLHQTHAGKKGAEG